MFLSTQSGVLEFQYRPIEDIAPDRSDLEFMVVNSVDLGVRWTWGEENSS